MRHRLRSVRLQVFYLDGKRQVLDVETFDQLSAHALWLVQVLAMQAYVITEVHHSVHYTKARGVQVAEHTGPGLEPVMNKIVKVLEDTFTTDLFHAKEVYGLPRVRPRVNVLQCRAVMKRDVNGILWFMHFEEMVTRRTEHEKPVFRRDKPAEQWADAEVRRAADEAEHELRTLLQHGLERGISLRQAFEHFDVAGVGMIHPNDFATGLKLLSIDLHPAAAKELASRLPVNRVSLIGPEQFVIWCETGEHAIRDAPNARPPTHSRRKKALRRSRQSRSAGSSATPAAVKRDRGGSFGGLDDTGKAGTESQQRVAHGRHLWGVHLAPRQ